jgi:hypothetical protein
MSGYEAWSCMLDVWSLLLFGTRRITTMKVVYSDYGWQSNAFEQAHSPKSVTGLLLPRFPFFLASRTSPAHFFTQILTHSRRINWALLTFSNGSHDSIVSKISGNVVSQCRGPSCSCSQRFCHWILNRYFFSINPATDTFFHLLQPLKLRSCILLANCFKQNWVCFKLIVALPSIRP